MVIVLTRTEWMAEIKTRADAATIEDHGLRSEWLPLQQAAEYRGRAIKAMRAEGLTYAYTPEERAQADRETERIYGRRNQVTR